MDTLRLIKPNINYSNQIIEYRNEFIFNKDSMDGSASLIKYDNPEDWINYLKITSNKKNCPKDRVIDSEFISVRESDNKIIGMINIRHELNEYLLNFGGNIGYSVRKSERNKGYAKEQLRLALMECKNLGLKKVLITCDKNNIGSRKTILSSNGIFENEINNEDNSSITQRYWINI